MNKKTSIAFIKSDFLQCSYLFSVQEVNEKVSNFLLRFYICETFIKNICIKYLKSIGKSIDKNKIKLDINNLTKALEYFDVSFDYEKINSLFGSAGTNYMNYSAKKLRNKVVHETNANVLRVIVERYDELMDLLNYFESLFK